MRATSALLCLLVSVCLFATGDAYAAKRKRVRTGHAAVASTADIGGWTSATVSPVVHSGGYTTPDLAQTGSRIFYIDPTNGVDSTTVSVASYYFWDGTNIVDTTGSTTNPGNGQAYGTDPRNPNQAAIKPYKRWAYVGPRRNCGDIATVDDVGWPAQACATNRAAKPDWWLFKRGETIDLTTDLLGYKQEAVPGATNISSSLTSGGSTVCCQVFGAYGATTTARPKFIHPQNSYITRTYSASAPTWQNVRYEGLHFDGHDRATGYNWTFSFLNHLDASTGIVFEDDWFDGTKEINLQSAGDYRFKRIIMNDSWRATADPFGGHNQGIFFLGHTSTTIFRIEDSIFVRNGFTTGDPSTTTWPPTSPVLFDAFSRNLYFKGNVDRATSGIFNTVVLAGGSGDQFRQGGRVEGNFFYTGYIVFNGESGTVGETNSGTLQNNVLQTYVNGTAHPGWGFNVGHGLHDVTVSGNIVTRAQSGRTLGVSNYSLHLKAINDDIPNDTHLGPLNFATQNNTVTGNVFDAGAFTYAVQITDTSTSASTTGSDIWSFEWPGIGVGGTSGILSNTVTSNVFVYDNVGSLKTYTTYTGLGSSCGTNTGRPGTAPVLTTPCPANGRDPNTGSGTLGSMSMQGSAVNEKWTITATSATNFNVTGSVSGAQAAATVGTPYNNGKVAFTLTAGGTPWVAGDAFIFSTTATVSPDSTTITGNDTYASMAAAAAAKGYQATDRTLVTYLQSIGDSVSSADGLTEYYAKLSTIRRGQWPLKYTAKPIVNHIRGGFGMSALP